MTRKRGLERMHEPLEALLSSVAETLPDRALSPEEKEALVENLLDAVQGEETLRAVGQGLGRVLLASYKAFLAGA